MSKHRRARSRTLRTSRTPRAGRTRTSSPTSRRVALAATLGLLTFAAGWVYALDENAGGTAAQARADSRPPAADRAARDAPREAPREAPRDPLQGLTGISEQTRARIPAESRQLILVTGRARDSSESTAALYNRPAAGADWIRAASWPARNGAKGWSTERTYGDLTSPQGVFALTDAGGLLPKPPGTRLPYDKDASFVATGRGVNGESLAGSFDYVVAIDFNRRPGTSPLDPVKPEGERKGGNIWLHVDHDGPSQGCVGIPKEAMKQVLETLDPAAKPVIVMGPEGF
ncbi:L,D-transpeptidase family protein [Streptomyces sp. NBC_01294]|uniref:L,D-transpeptidase family protein n=1 Tax=Streptomyces sp. NBC_01294 TaxID=2903815 RepID=UPI002DDB1412|nr:L,D-transpeptidase family protein [Streptomyces sp. NBC_01294]WRZ58773.1 L,D-transpeptidase family protein [Streptomyces sp. NBC_01294]